MYIVYSSDEIDPSGQRTRARYVLVNCTWPIADDIIIIETISDFKTVGSDSVRYNILAPIIVGIFFLSEPNNS